jgi:hypothetical protein
MERMKYSRASDSEVAGSSSPVTKPLERPADRNHRAVGVDSAKASASSPSGVVLSIASPKLTPRQLLAVAQQSSSPVAALNAAKSMARCRALAGSSQRVREALVVSGKHQMPSQNENLAKYIDRPERECEELDAYMKAQYEPMLRQAMSGGVQGAAAMWWVTPEGKAVSNINSQREALEMLRQDAFACDKSSLLTLQAVAFRHPKAFSESDVAAVGVAAERLEASGRLKGQSALKEAMSLLPTFNLRTFFSKDAINAKADQIVEACKDN